MKRLRFSLRVKLALLLLALLALPCAGVLYVNEVERYLLQGQEQSLLAVARAVATALHERPQLLASASGRDDEVDAILLGLQRTSSRVWVVDRSYQVIASAGSLRRPVEVSEEASWWQPLLVRSVGWLIPRPTEDFIESNPEDVLATGSDVAAAMQGTPATRTRTTRDGRAVVISAAHPIWNGDEVAGAVVTEETTNSVMSVRTAALERLLWLTLAAFAGAGILLMAFATRLSMRIRRLRDEAESAIDARGHITTRLTAGSNARDEIGDLSRSFSAVLARLAEHHSYLESMAGRLSHELRTPIAVVRSSLENLKLSNEDAALYIERAEQGLARLGRILERMTEASRLEQSLRAVERERYDLAAVVRGCVEGYRLAYPQAAFAVELPQGRAVEVEGAPDLAAQLLDKLVENAVDFSNGAAPIRVTLDDKGGSAVLTVSNKGPLLPEKMRTRLFESMISMRDATGTGTPHLGLGLYVARLIAEFHGGTIAASNLPGGDGVALGVRIPLAWK
jgi:two-component system, OmpR family, sensor histidine kinase ChvG